MSKGTLTRATEPGAVEVRYRPLYARALGLRHLHPGGMLCFVFLEGAVALGLLLALAELVSWWVVLVLPVSVALMVKVNDLVAGAVARSAARTPERERERLLREVIAFMPTVGLDPAHLDRSDAGVDRGDASLDDPPTASDTSSSLATARGEASVDRSTAAVDRSDASLGRGDASLDRGDAGWGWGDAGWDRGEASADRGDTSAERSDASLGLGDTSADRGDTSAERSDASLDRGDTSAQRSDAVAALSEATAQLPVALKQDDDGPAPDQPAESASEGAGESLTEATAQYPVVPQPAREIDPVAAGRRDTAGRYAEAGRYLDAAWRQHAYAMARHAKQADPTVQHQRQSAAHRYE